MQDAADPRLQLVLASGRSGPPVNCTMLQSLDCSGCKQVADLGPLQSINCSYCEVADLGPLSACMMLREIICHWTPILVLSPLAACTALLSLTCDTRVPLEQIRLLQVACCSLEVTTVRSKIQCYSEVQVEEVYPPLNPKA